MIGDSNWLRREQYKSFGAIITLLIKKLNESGVSKLSFNCGFTPCMFEPAQIEYFLEKRVKIFGWGCDGKKGSFDIGADLSVFPCFVLEDYKAKNIFDFNDAEKAKKFLENLLHYTIEDSQFSVLDQCRSCPYFQGKKCRGPCWGRIINNSDQQQIFANFKKFLYSKTVYNILFLSRNWP